MSGTVGDFILERMIDWGVTRVYAYPGDGIHGLMGAFGRIGERLRFVQVRHEEAAAFMACAHAKLTGEVGVCVATSGPGAIHLLSGLYDAKLDHQPVVAIIGQTTRATIGGDYPQEVDLQCLFKDVAHEYVHTAMAESQVRHLMDRAFRNARFTRSPSVIIVPLDVQELPARRPAHRHATVHSGLGYSKPRVLPSQQDLQRAADILNEGQRVAILAGAGCLHAGEELSQVADLLGAGVAKALLGKCVLPDTLPYVTGALGLIGTKPSWDMMVGCDTLLVVGSSFPYPEFLPDEGQARGVQIDIDGRMLSIRYPMELAMVGDSAESLRALIPLLRRKTERGWRAFIEQQVERWWKELEARAMTVANQVNPERVFWELSARLPSNAILTTGSGSSVHWFARDIKVRAGMMATLSGNLDAMGCGVSYAIAAKFAFPERVVVAMVGDGAMQMSGNAELITAAKYYEDWTDPRLIVVVLNNRALNQVRWEMRAFEGDPKYEASQALPDFPYARYAEQLGLIGVTIEHPDEIGPVLERALSGERPIVVEVRADPDVSPLPAHISFEQASAHARARAEGKGDMEDWAALRAVMRGAAEPFTPEPDRA